MSFDLSIGSFIWFPLLAKCSKPTVNDQFVPLRVMTDNSCHNAGRNVFQFTWACPVLHEVCESHRKRNIRNKQSKHTLSKRECSSTTVHWHSWCSKACLLWSCNSKHQISRNSNAPAAHSLWAWWPTFITSLALKQKHVPVHAMDSKSIRTLTGQTRPASYRDWHDHQWWKNWPGNTTNKACTAQDTTQNKTALAQPICQIFETIFTWNAYNEAFFHIFSTAKNKSGKIFSGQQWQNNYITRTVNTI